MTRRLETSTLALFLAWLGVLLWCAAAVRAGWQVSDDSAAAPLATVIPNDPCFTGESPCSGDGQWNLVKINAPEAWSYTTGSEEVVIAILDTGIDLNHPDLASKLWVNPGEIPSDGIDNDGNGYVDDVHGYDFANDDPDPSDDSGWGTLVAGIAAAATDNGEGIAGTVWGARLMAVKVFVPTPDGGRSGDVSWVVDGIHYAADMGTPGALIINLSWTTELTEEKRAELEAAVLYAHDKGALLIAPVGSPLSPEPAYPAALPHVIGVTATDRDDVLLGSAQPGDFVDIAAPGQDIWGTFPLSPWNYWRGWNTESAVPQVAGLAALAWSIDAAQTDPDAIWEYIRTGAAKVGEEPYDENGWNQYYGYGRIDALQTLLNTPHFLQIKPSSLAFQGDGTITPSAHYIINTTASAGAWTAVTDVDWLALEGPTGNTPSQLGVSGVEEQLPESRCGTLTGSIQVDSTLPHAINSPRTVEVLLHLPACTTGTPTVTPTATPSPSTTSTPHLSPTATPSVTPSATASLTPTPTASPTLVPPPTVVTTPPTLDRLVYLPLLAKAGIGRDK